VDSTVPSWKTPQQNAIGSSLVLVQPSSNIKPVSIGIEEMTASILYRVSVHIGRQKQKVIRGHKSPPSGAETLVITREPSHSTEDIIQLRPDVRN
jgi:hypothetical protein